MPAYSCPAFRVCGRAQPELPGLGLKDTEEEKITRLLNDAPRHADPKVNQVMAHVSPITWIRKAGITKVSGPIWTKS